jgi:predicted nucleotide-binding protein
MAFRAQESNRDFLTPTHIPHPYSPDLNPDECLNNLMKMMFQNRVQPHNEEELKKKIGSVLKKRQRDPDKTTKFFDKKHIFHVSGKKEIAKKQQG